MKTRFIIIRHGFSVANNLKKFAGHSDFELTELGKLQAEKCAEALKGEKIDAIYSSDLLRAHCTAIPIANALGLSINDTESLREIYAGEWEGVLFDEICERYKESYDVWKNDIGRAKCTGGESIEELAARIVKALSDIAEDNDGKTVCITTHATPIRAICTLAAGLPVCEMAKTSWVSNASINIFDFEDGVFTAVEVNKNDHLGTLKTKLPTNV